MVFGNLGKMGEMLKQAREMQKQMSQIVVEKVEGGVKVVANGEMDILGVEIGSGAAQNDMKKLGESVKKAVNGALKEAKAAAAKKLGGMSGMGLPF